MSQHQTKTSSVTKTSLSILYEEAYAEKWMALAKREGHRPSPPADATKQAKLQAIARKGAEATLRKRVTESAGEKMCNRAMFLAKKHPPLMSRHLVSKYGVTESYSRKIIMKLSQQGKIKCIGQDEFNAKMWVPR